MLTRRSKMSLEERKGLWGWLFIAPWLVGFTLLFAVPLFQSVRYSFSELSLTASGLQLDYTALANYRYSVMQHVDYNRTLVEAVVNMIVNVPLIIIFSLFVATLLNQRFKGRMAARAIFFLPVILASGVIASIESGDYLQSAMMGGGADSNAGSGSMLRSFELEKLLLQSGMNEFFVVYLTGAVDRIYEIVSASGVQIIIFLAGLQSIAPQLYEASKIEGATGYEAFWKITFPMISPLILTNVIYTVIDSFTNNDMTMLIQETAFQQFNFGLSAAMSWMYFLIIAVILFITTYLISKKVFYQ
ncbi:ABC-type sugar transport system, permease component [Evansella caseinilytica]|uniref:ABC-type sugar transport system, permease component n=1 Tax=Evansella caseinilytica TaxID=1503961 RepID=A0A1H3P2L0_9BACI|nr:sugar ABC transporter permease [Evansella caseinilytica]SDY95394.1 ABC-type sugar transport system, permease component [Evansella caseinilytica]